MKPSLQLAFKTPSLLNFYNKENMKLDSTISPPTKQNQKKKKRTQPTKKRNYWHHIRTRHLIWNITAKLIKQEAPREVVHELSRPSLT